MSICCVAAILTVTSCRKQTKEQNTRDPELPRKIQFQLYTDKDFSGNTDDIYFSLFIHNSTNKVLWDSLLPVMKIKDIPDLAHKLVMEKSIIVKNSSILKVGFHYVIGNVGNANYIDTSNAGQTIKIVAFKFQ